MVEEEREWRKYGYNHRELSNAAWVILATNCVYIAVPKCANTTMKTLLAEGVPSNRLMNKLKSEVQMELASDDLLIHCYVPPGLARTRALHLTPGDLTADTQRCFTVVRHPVSRFFSAWRDQVHSSRATQLKEALRVSLSQRKESDFFSIDDLIAYVEETPPERMDCHVRPQWLCCGAGRIPMEATGKVESLQQDVQTLAEAGLIPAASVHRLSVRNASGSYQGYELTAKQESRIAELYTRDFEMFGYQ